MNDWGGSIARLESAEDLECSVDEVLRLLSHRSVRGTIVLLYNRPDTTRERLASVLATRDAADGDTIATQRDVDRVAVELHHVALPRLADVGWIAYDPDDGSVIDTGIPDAVFATVIEDVDHG